jgi:hypothetical protein
MRDPIETAIGIVITTFIYGAIPVSFVLISGFIVLKRYRKLLPVVAALFVYLAISYIMLFGDRTGGIPPVPGYLTLGLLSVMLPAIVTLAGIVWTLVVSNSVRERWWGIAISVVGSGLTALQAFIYIQLAWYAI